MASELDWSHNISDIPETGLAAERQATPEARSRIAADLDLLACDRLEARYEVKPLSQGRILLQGTLEAEVTQSCVVTLEPVRDHIIEPFEVEFRPESAETAGVAEFDAFEVRDIEPLEDDTIPVGRIVYEHLASAINPYPRKEGVAFEQPGAKGDEDVSSESPFAVLKQLKSRE